MKKEPAKLASRSRSGPAIASTPFVCQDGSLLSLHFGIDSAQSTMDEEDPTRLVFSYTRLMMAFLLFEACPGHIGFVGLGGGSLPKYCYKHLPRTLLTVTEISAKVIAIRHVFRVPDDNARLQIVQADGGAFIAERRGAFDVLMIDAFDSSGQPPHLCVEPFYQACLDALTPRGILVVNLCHDGWRTSANHIERVFGQDAICLRAPDGSNRILIVSRRAMVASERALRLRAKALEASHPLPFQPMVDEVLKSWGMARVRSIDSGTKSNGRPARSKPVAAETSKRAEVRKKSAALPSRRKVLQYPGKLKK